MIFIFVRRYFLSFFFVHYTSMEKDQYIQKREKRKRRYFENEHTFFVQSRKMLIDHDISFAMRSSLHADNSMNDVRSNKIKAESNGRYRIEKFNHTHLLLIRSPFSINLQKKRNIKQDELEQDTNLWKIVKGNLLKLVVVHVHLEIMHHIFFQVCICLYARPVKSSRL